MTNLLSALPVVPLVSESAFCALCPVNDARPPFIFFPSDLSGAQYWLELLDPDVIKRARLDDAVDDGRRRPRLRLCSKHFYPNDISAWPSAAWREMGIKIHLPLPIDMRPASTCPICNGDLEIATVIPKSPTVRADWLKRLDLDETKHHLLDVRGQQGVRDRICFRHFAAEDFIGGRNGEQSGAFRIRSEAVPIDVARAYADKASRKKKPAKNSSGTDEFLRHHNKCVLCNEPMQIGFHIPEIVEERVAWFDRLNLDPAARGQLEHSIAQDGQRIRICNRHFADDAYYKEDWSKRHFLNPGARPIDMRPSADTIGKTGITNPAVESDNAFHESTSPGNAPPSFCSICAEEMDVTFNWPTDVVEQSRWINSLQLPPGGKFVKQIVAALARGQLVGICARHFQSTDFYKHGPTHQLCHDAVPQSIARTASRRICLVCAKAYTAGFGIPDVSWKEWLDALRLDMVTLNKLERKRQLGRRVVICLRHFQADDYTKFSTTFTYRLMSPVLPIPVAKTDSIVATEKKMDSLPSFCNRCETKLANRTMLVEHMRVVHEVSSDAFEFARCLRCQFCCQLTDTLESMYVHLVQCHQKSFTALPGTILDMVKRMRSLLKHWVWAPVDAVATVKLAHDHGSIHLRCYGNVPSLKRILLCDAKAITDKEPEVYDNEGTDVIPAISAIVKPEPSSEFDRPSTSRHTNPIGSAQVTVDMASLSSVDEKASSSQGNTKTRTASKRKQALELDDSDSDFSGMDDGDAPMASTYFIGVRSGQKRQTFINAKEKMSKMTVDQNTNKKATKRSPSSPFTLDSEEEEGEHDEEAKEKEQSKRAKRIPTGKLPDALDGLSPSPIRIEDLDWDEDESNEPRTSETAIAPIKSGASKRKNLMSLGCGINIPAEPSTSPTPEEKTVEPETSLDSDDDYKPGSQCQSRTRRNKKKKILKKPIPVEQLDLAGNDLKKTAQNLSTVLNSKSDTFKSATPPEIASLTSEQLIALYSAQCNTAGTAMQKQKPMQFLGEWPRSVSSSGDNCACPICGRTFASFYFRKLHEATAHLVIHQRQTIQQQQQNQRGQKIQFEKDGSNRYLCPIRPCAVRFRSVSARILNYHFGGAHHNLMKVDKDMQLWYLCLTQSCNRVFVSAAQQRLHKNRGCDGLPRQTMAERYSEYRRNLVRPASFLRPSTSSSVANAGLSAVSLMQTSSTVIPGITVSSMDCPDEGSRIFDGTIETAVKSEEDDCCLDSAAFSSVFEEDNDDADGN